MKKLHVLILLLSILTVSLSALELREGRIKLILHEDIGRFSLYYLEDLNSGRYKSLIVDEDPRTSLLSVRVGNRTLRIGEVSGFRSTVEETANGAKFIWRSSSIEVTQEFSFIKSKSSSLVDGIKVDLDIQNVSERSLTLGVRYIFDTYLGEDTNTHFITSSAAGFSNETDIAEKNPAYWYSAERKESDIGFQMFFNSFTTKPAKIILANWKRLNESTWAYEVNPNRNFNLLPYSINDSAAAIYYSSRDVAKDETYSVSAIFGNIATDGYDLTSSFTSESTSLSNILESVTSSTSSSGNTNNTTSVQTDLIAIEDLLEQIDIWLESGENITEEQLAIVEKVVNELNLRKKQY